MAEIDDLRDELILARNLYDELQSSALRDRNNFEAKIKGLHEALNAIDTPVQLLPNQDPAEFWKHVASKRREIAHEALKNG